MDENELTATEIEAAIETWCNEVVAAVSKREDVSPADKKRAEKEYGDVEYADEKNKKYPLDKEHIHAAWSYINMPKNASKYSAEELKTIKNKIKRAAKKFGMEISDEKKSEAKSSKESDMADEEKKETPEEEKKESPEKENEEKKSGVEAEVVEAEKKPEMDADYAMMSKKVADLGAELEAKKADLKNEQDAKAAVEAKYTALEARVVTLEAALGEARNSLKASKVAELKSKLVGAVMDEEEFEAKKDTLIDLPDAALEILMRVDKKSSNGTRQDNRLAASEKAPNGQIHLVY